MKMFLVSVLCLLGMNVAHANDYEMPTLPVQLEQQVNASIPADANDANIMSRSRYCCIREGGTYCDMGYYDDFGQPCKCSTGNQIWHGHVCR